MNMFLVVSSNLVAVGYEPSKRELTIQFKNGVYTYSNVPEFEYQNLLTSPSKGSYVHSHIKRYPSRHGY